MRGFGEMLMILSFVLLYAGGMAVVEDPGSCGDAAECPARNGTGDHVGFVQAKLSRAAVLQKEAAEEDMF